ncbi:TlpA family protein disulfide reductase [Ferruginibacter albus]|uniref:TlpA family protein disulfide reductase n=1 Tax=Ferruginibacter albus TaxID=2875540 RepID=UPI001CC793EB|nr:thioredoxin fold domain-containing protein [Ferruginibacter albus]UAY50895.1 thioredoxin family protein [Ferruginibacter albus]
MKKILSIVSVLFISVSSFAQTAVNTDSLPTYKRFPEIPVFKLTKVPDSTEFSKADIKKNKDVIMIMFSPDCEHCQRETDSILAHFDAFKNVQIVMASPLDYVHIKNFYQKFHLADYPNITIGKDNVWALGTFYNVRNFPTIAVYDKHGQFVQIFEGSIPVQKVIAALP